MAMPHGHWPSKLNRNPKINNKVHRSLSLPITVTLTLKPNHSRYKQFVQKSDNMPLWNEIF